ncbi:unnamed protein product [Linum trigynum]|uniref:Leucine-rich repeat-containing N-terminal plant-type domain-containing protein n=1 Tax=Linum trigynum TaxID=586398 RepID=A0AAV2CSR5_9ROSI
MAGKIILIHSILLLLFLTFPQPSTPESIQARISLLQFIETLSEGTFPPHSNWGWNLTSDPCHDWAGVVCDSDDRVMALTLNMVNLTGRLDLKLLCRTIQYSLKALDLTDNYIFSRLSFEIACFTNLTYLRLGGNRLHGSLPVSLASLTGLSLVDVSRNRFSGPIPTGLGRLNIFLAQENRFDGDIPGEVNFAGLEAYNVSRNRLVGPIPSGFLDFPASSFEGNPGLCGLPLPVPCAPSPAPSPAMRGD